MVILAVMLLGVALPASAQDAGQWLDGADWRGWLGAQEIGGHKDTATAPQFGNGGESDTGRRLKAGGLSLLVPGAGQLFNGQRSKGLIMIGVEAVIWGSYFGFDKHAGNLEDDYRNWSGVYAGTSGDHGDTYWQAVGRYADSDAWYESQLREARAFGEDEPAPLGDDEEWQWRNDAYRSDYRELRADANEAADRRDMMILFAILNRAVSIFDAVRHGGEPDGEGAPAIGAEVFGMDLALEVSMPLPRPEARAVARWSF